MISMGGAIIMVGSELEGGNFFLAKSELCFIFNKLEGIQDFSISLNKSKL